MRLADLVTALRLRLVQCGAGRTVQAIRRVSARQPAPASGRALGPDAAPVALHDALGRRQSDADTLELSTVLTSHHSRQRHFTIIGLADAKLAIFIEPVIQR